jgi:hypothetical protein
MASLANATTTTSGFTGTGWNYRNVTHERLERCTINTWLVWTESLS